MIKQVGFISFRLKKIATLQNNEWQIIPLNKYAHLSENVMWLSDLPKEVLWLHEIALYRDVKPIDFIPAIRHPHPINEQQLIENAIDFSAVISFFAKATLFPEMNLNNTRLSLAISQDRKMMQKFSQSNFDRIDNKIALQISHNIIEGFTVSKKEDLPKKISIIQLYPKLNQNTTNKIKFPKGNPQFVGHDGVKGIDATSFTILEYPFFIKLLEKKIKPQYTSYRSILEKLLFSYFGCQRLERDWFFKDEFYLINRFFNFEIADAVLFDHWDENSAKYFPDLDTNAESDFVKEVINRVYWHARTENDETQPHKLISGLSGSITNSFVRSKIIIPFCLTLQDNGFNILSIHPQYIEIYFDNTKDNTTMLQLLLKLVKENEFQFVEA